MGTHPHEWKARLDVERVKRTLERGLPTALLEAFHEGQSFGHVHSRRSSVLSWGQLMAGRFGILPARAIEDVRLSHSALRMLGVVSTFADKEGWCWPSQTTLGSRMAITQQAASRLLTQLEKLGYIESRRQYKKDGFETTKLYRVVYDFDVAPVVPATTSEGVPGTLSGVVPGTPSEVVQNDPIELPKRTKVVVDEAFVVAMVEKHADSFTETEVRQEIIDAMNHTAQQHAIDKRLYVQKWLRNAIKFKQERAPNRRPAFNNDAATRSHGEYEKVINRG